MFCKNCGTPLNNDQRFCTKCGAPLDTVPPRQNPGEQQSQPFHGQIPPQTQQHMNYQQHSNYQPQHHADDTALPPRKPQKQKRPKLLFAIPVLVIFLILAGIFVINASAISNTFRKTFSSPEDYFEYVASKSSNNILDTLSAAYDQYLTKQNSLQTQFQTTASLTLEDGGKTLLNTLLPATRLPFSTADWSALESAGISVAYENKETPAASFSLALNQEDLLHLDSSLNLKENTVCLNIPELTDSYLSTTLPPEMQNWEEAFLTENTDNPIPDGKTLNDLLLPYTNMMIESASKVEKSEAEITASSVSQKCTVLTANWDSQALTTLVQTMLRKSQEDKLLQKLFQSPLFLPYLTMAGTAEYYTEMDTYLTEQDIADTQIPFSIQADFYVDSKGNIIGVLMTLIDPYQESIAINSLCTRSGKEIGIEVSVQQGMMTYMEISGTCRLSGTSINGDLRFLADNEKIAQLTLEDFKLKNIFSGELSGTATIQPSIPSDTYLYMDPSAAAYISSSSFKFTFNCDKKSEEIQLTVNSNDSPLVTLKLENMYGNSKQISVPTGSDTIYSADDSTEMLSWFNTLDWNRLNEILDNSPLPSEFTDSLKQDILSFQTTLQYYQEFA